MRACESVIGRVDETAVTLALEILNLFGMDPLVVNVLAIERRDWDAFTNLLHPYLRWTLPNGQTIRGRRQVLMHLETTPPREQPEQYELRDGQIYRWNEKPAQ